MTRTQVNHLIAARTGESLAVIRRLGFQLQVEPREEPVAEEIRLVVHCPFCRGQVPYPGRSRDGSTALAECDDCDVYFPFEDRDVFPASSRDGREPVAGPPPLHPGLTAARIGSSRRIPHRSPTPIPSTEESCSMITLTRSQVRRLRVAFRRSALGITHRGIVSALVLRAEGGQLRAQHRYCDLAVEHVEPGSYRPADEPRHPARRPGRLRGPGRHARRPRVRRPRPDRRPLGGPRHPAEPRVRPRHARRPPGADARRCRRPGHRTRPSCSTPWPRRPRPARPTRPAMPSSASSSRATAARSSPPTAGNCWSARASASPGPSDLLIKGSPDLRLPGPAARSAGRGGPDRHPRRLPRRPLDDLPARSRRTSGSRTSSG